jgi:hypothetical protein
MMTLARNNKILLAAVLVVAVAVAGFWFGVLAPQRQHVSTLDTQISAKQGELASAQSQIASYEKAQAAYKATNAKLVGLGTAVPADDDVRSLMVQLGGATKATHVEFQKVDVGGGASGSGSGSTASPASTTTSGVGPNGTLASAPGLVPVGSTGVSALPFTLTFDGQFMNLSQFFTRLQHFVDVRNEQVSVKGRLLRLETINIGPSGSGWPRMIASVGASSYVTTPVPPLSGSGTTAATGTGTQPVSGGGTTTTHTTTATVTGVAR